MRIIYVTGEFVSNITKLVNDKIEAMEKDGFEILGIHPAIFVDPLFIVGIVIRKKKTRKRK